LADADVIAINIAAWHCSHSLEHLRLALLDILIKYYFHLHQIRICSTKSTGRSASI